MASLTREQEQIVVVWLACYLSLEEVRAEIEKRFGILLTEAEVQVYDASVSDGPPLNGNEDLCSLFLRVREACDAARGPAPIAGKNYRLRRLQALIDNPASVTNPQMMLKAIEQAAKEMGGLYTRPAKEPEVQTEALSTALEEGIERVYGNSS